MVTRSSLAAPPAAARIDDPRAQRCREDADLGAARQELVVFDINRRSSMRGFFRNDPADRLRSLPTSSKG
jgi:hypothetical protein